MTAALAHDVRRQGEWLRLPLPLRLAFRDLRGTGFSGFAIFFLCIALGVGAIGAINGLSAALQSALLRDGKTLLGGDVEAGLIHRQATEVEKAYLTAQGSVSEVASIRAMARKPAGDAQTLVDLKAVDNAYPLYGEATLDGGMSLASAIGEKGGIATDRALLDLLQIELGDSIVIGEAAFTVRAIVEKEPDRLAAGPSFGSKIILSQASLQKTGLVQPGSLIRWSYRIKTDTGTGFKQALARQFPEAGFQVRDSRDPSPGLSATLKQLTDFLTLVGLTALLTGGIGVANAVAAFVDRRLKTIAIYKALGAGQAMILQVFVYEIALLTAAGIAAGLLTAIVVPMALTAFLGSLIPIGIDAEIHARPLAVAALFGVLASVPFILWPLGKAQQVRTAELFRNSEAEARFLPPRNYAIGTAVSIAALAAAIVLLSQQRLLAALTCAALLLIFTLFLGVGHGIRVASSRLRRPRGRPSLALALANLSGPGGLTRTVALSLGLGLTLLTAVSVLNAALTDELQRGLPDRAPSHFFIGIPKTSLDAFQSLLTERHPTSRVTIAPMLRGRLTALRDVPVEKIEPAGNADWVLNGDRGLTYSEALPQGSELTEGEWWPANYEGGPLVSFEAGIAKTLKLKLGDSVTVNVLGRNVRATIANFRKVNWSSMDINFIMIFSPNALRAAPFTYLATLTPPTGAAIDREADTATVKSVAAQFPAVSVVNVREALDAVQGVVRKIMLAIRAAGGVTLAMGLIVVAGALLAAQRRRIYEAVVLRVLGARKHNIIAAHLIEYLFLTAGVSAAAMALGLGAAYAILTYTMGISFRLPLAALLQPSILETICVLVLGTVGTLKVLSAKPAHYLRTE